MRIYKTYEDIPKNAIYLGSENGDGSIQEEVLNYVNEAINPVCLKDYQGIKHYFDLGVSYDL